MYPQSSARVDNRENAMAKSVRVDSPFYGSIIENCSNFAGTSII